MKAFILTTVILLNATASFAQFDFDNKRSENLMVGEDVMVANPHLFTDDPFYGYEHFSFSYNQREISLDPVANNMGYVHKGMFVFWLSFHKEKCRYQINLFELHGDSNQDRLISFGMFQEEDERYIFTDKMSGVRMEAEMRYVASWGNILVFDKSYPHFKRKAFEWDRHLNLDTIVCSMDSTYIHSICQSAKIKRPIRKPTIGSYQSEDCDLFLLLNSDATYRYYVCGLLLSEGMWEQKGQRLDLHDKHLNHTFYGKITNQGIWSGSWPGDMEGTLLKKVEE